ILDGGQMGKRIPAGKFDGSCEAVQPLLKLRYGFRRLVEDHCCRLKGREAGSYHSPEDLLNGSPSRPVYQVL
ncbi:MAG TPA: hypothetical protein VG453_05050, partial [Nitrospira sp.]|nr:hypothetical protein [Nitrospira sp.]